MLERQKDPKYQFTVNESGVWAQVGDKLNKNDEALKKEEDYYRHKIRVVNEDKDRWIKDRIREQKKKESGKALFDTSESDIGEDLEELAIHQDRLV